MSEIIARLVDLPYHIPGLCAVDENGEPMIYLNARLTSVQHLRTYDHEMKHIRQDDLYNDQSIHQVEALPDPGGMVPVEQIYRRGLELFNLAFDDPFWLKLWDIWALQHEKDIMRIVSKPIDGYTQRQAKKMFKSIFAPWLAYQASDNKD